MRPPGRGCLSLAAARLAIATARLVAIAALGPLGCASPPPPATPVTDSGHVAFATSDFAFGRGVPVGGRRLTACGRVTLTTTNTERSGDSAFRIPAGTDGHAEIILTFDRPVTAVELTVGGLNAGDTLGDFNVGSPPRLSGNLIQTAEGRVTAGSNNSAGHGTLSWPELEVPELRLVLDAGGPNASISVERFRISCRTLPPPGASP